MPLDQTVIAEKKVNPALWVRMAFREKGGRLDQVDRPGLKENLAIEGYKGTLATPEHRGRRELLDLRD